MNARLYNFRLRFSEALGENTIPTIFLKLPFDQYDMLVMESVADFLELHYSEDGIGYVLKLPFCTNSEGLKFPNNFPMVCWLLSCCLLSLGPKINLIFFFNVLATAF